MGRMTMSTGILGLIEWLWKERVGIGKEKSELYAEGAEQKLLPSRHFRALWDHE